MPAWVGPREEPRKYRFAGTGEPVGGGGEGFVYRAWRAQDGQTVAIKQLTAVTPEDWATQVARIEILGTADHPRLGRHLDAFVGCYPFDGEVPADEEFEVCYTVMAWVEGEDLSTAASGAELPVVFGWVRDVAHAAAALHRHPTPTGLGIVHRDIKPSNVRVSKYDSSARTGAGAVLVDFGIARPLTGPSMTRHAGAPGWMPPEAFEDHRSVGARSDTWQVAGLAAWALLGSPPGALVGPDRRRRLEDSLRERGAPEARKIARHIDAALAPRPADRPADLERWGDTLVGLVLRTSQPRRRAVLAGTTAALALLAGAVLWRTTTTTSIPPSTTAAPEPAAHVAVGEDVMSPFDFGEPIPLVVTHTGRAPVAGRLIAEARTAGRPTAGTTPVEVDAIGPRQTVSLIVNRPPDQGAVIIDELALQLRDSSGEPTADVTVPIRLQVGPPLGDPETCTTYDPATLRVEAEGSDTWRVLAGPVELARLATRTSADTAADVARQADAACVIPSAPGDPPVQYWRRDGRLLGTLPSSPTREGAACTSFRPGDAKVVDRSLFLGDVLVTELAGDHEANQALHLALHYRNLCVVGRFDTNRASAATFSYWQ